MMKRGENKNQQIRKLCPRPRKLSNTISEYSAMTRSSTERKGLRLSVSSSKKEHKSSGSEDFLNFLNCDNICSMEIEKNNDLQEDFYIDHGEQNLQWILKDSMSVADSQAKYQIKNDSAMTQASNSRLPKKPATPITKLMDLEPEKVDPIKVGGILLISSSSPAKSTKSQIISKDSFMIESQVESAFDPQKIFHMQKISSNPEKTGLKKQTKATKIKFNLQKGEKFLF